MKITDDSIWVAACAIANERGMRNGMPYVKDCLNLLPEHRMKNFLDEARAALRAVEKSNSASTNTASDEIADYDCGIINDYGGGNVQWWQDYLRHEINRCNEYWRSATSHVA